MHKIYSLLHSNFDEDDDGGNDVSNLLRMTIWRISFSDNNVKVGMILSSWNKFLRSLFYFIVVRSNHNKG
jgi:hypothetical protein